MTSTSTAASASALQSSLTKLSIEPSAPKILTNPIQTQDLADSWEEVQEAEADSQQYTTNPSTSAQNPPNRNIPSPPPPTPISPGIKTKATAATSPYQTLPPYGMNGTERSASGGNSNPASGRSTPRASTPGEPDKRPEKTTSTAARLIAAGLGQRAPRRTEEERKYDQAMRVQEKKKRDAAKAEEERKKEELEKAKKSIWED